MKPQSQPVRFLAIVVLLLAITSVPARADIQPVPFLKVHAGPGLSLHKEMFMLPVTLSDVYDGAQTEAVFQLSAKHRLFNTPLYFGYTQISFWQAYDHNNSAPFRETNYNPELFYRTQRFPFHSGFVGLDIGFEHESNGQRPPVSRSWNLVYLAPYFYRSDVLVYLKYRYRIPEDDKDFPDAAVGDDNPDITDYLGHADLHVYCKFWRDHSVHLALRGSIKTGNGGVSLVYSIPVPKSVRSYFVIRLSHGYGESLVDYKRSLSRLGVGIMFR